MIPVEKKVAIIGCGYVGAALGAALAERGWHVCGTTTNPRRLSELRALGIEPAVVDVADLSPLREVLRERWAAYLTVAPPAERRDYRAVYLRGVENLLQAADGTPLRRIIYTSSTSVYGQHDGSWVDEDSPTEPSSENARILVAAEAALLDGAKVRGLTATVVRLSGIYGPSRDPAGRIDRVAGQERPYGEGYINLVHRDDIVAALGRLLDVEYRGILNLSDDQPLVRRELYDRLAARAGLRPVRWIKPDAAVGLGKRVRNERIKRLLGLTLQHPAYGTA